MFAPLSDVLRDCLIPSYVFEHTSPQDTVCLETCMICGVGKVLNWI